MSQISKNVVANYAGSFWNVLMSVTFVPVYIKLMGIEAYGLVGVFASLLALFSIMNMGLGATMTREMARLSALDPTGRDARGLARTLEVIYWSVALILGFVVIALAGPIADYWVKPEHLEPSVVKQALMITGGVVALRWPVAFYSGGLSGLDRQPLLNLILSGCATLRGVGAVLVLWLISPTIQAFFSFQIAASAVETSCLAGGLWWSLPGRGAKATFAISHLKRVWRFSAGMTGISVTVLLLMQTDKIILSKMLSLELFGYYSLAWTVSSVLLHIIGPIQTAVYPSLTRIVAQNSKQQLCNLYHRNLPNADRIARTRLAYANPVWRCSACNMVGRSCYRTQQRSYTKCSCSRHMSQWIYEYALFSPTCPWLDISCALSEYNICYRDDSGDGGSHSNLSGDGRRIRLGDS